MSKSILYANNSNSQAVATNGIINFGSAVRRYGCNCNVSGGNAIIEGTGYYSIDTNITFETGAGTTIITLYKDGVAIPGANVTVTTLADTIYSVSIPAVVRQQCCVQSTITVVLTGVAGTVTNASIEVRKE